MENESKKSLLFYLVNQESDEKFEITDSLLCGRSKSCHVHLDDSQISGKHIEIKIKGDQANIVDLNSANKTKLNNEFLAPNTPTPLKEDDHIYLGNYHFTFEASKFTPLTKEAPTELSLASEFERSPGEGLINEDHKIEKIIYRLNLKEKEQKEIVNNFKSKLDDMDKILTERNSLEQELNELKNKQESFGKEIQNLKKDEVEEKKGHLIKLEGDVTSKLKEIDDAKNQIDTLKEFISGKRQELHNLENTKNITSNLIQNYEKALIVSSDMIAIKNKLKSGQFKDKELNNKWQKIKKSYKEEQEKFTSLQLENSKLIEDKKLEIEKDKEIKKEKEKERIQNQIEELKKKLDD